MRSTISVADTMEVDLPIRCLIIPMKTMPTRIEIARVRSQPGEGRLVASRAGIGGGWRCGLRCGWGALFVLSATCMSAAAAITADRDFSQHIGPGPQQSAPEGQPPLTGPQQRQIDLFGDIVRNPSPDIDDETRRGVTAELLEIGRPEAFAPLQDAIRSRDPVRMLPVIDVLLQQPRPVAAMLDAIVDALGEAGAEAPDALGVLAGRYGDRAFERLAPRARDASLEDAARIGSIHALGYIRARDSVDLLMAVARPESDEPEPVREAAFASLRRLTGLDFDNDYQRWNRWWVQARELEIDEWLKQVIRSLSEQVAAVEARLADQQRANDAVAQRLGDTLRLLYRTLPSEQQFVRLAEDLRDPMPIVREAAIDRVARLLRDAVRPPDAVLEALAKRLDDTAPVLRRKAARLLNDLNYDGVQDRIVERLQTEDDATVAVELFTILANRPTPLAADVASRWLTNPAVHDAAAEAAWRVLTRPLLDDEQVGRLRETVQAAYDERATPHLARLLAVLAEDDELAPLLEYLDHEDVAYRRLVAEGLRHRGVIQPIIERAADVAIYPQAVRGLAETGDDIADLRQLVGLTPPEEHRDAWAQAVVDLSNAMPAWQLLDADNLLRESQAGSTDLRVRVLDRVEQLGPDDADSETRTALVVRLATILCSIRDTEGVNGATPISNGGPERAWQLIERHTNGVQSPELEYIRFRAAVLTGRFDIAHNLNSNPEAWVAIHQQLASARHDAATRLQDEIAARFGERTPGEDGAPDDPPASPASEHTADGNGSGSDPPSDTPDLAADAPGPGTMAHPE